MVQISNNPTMFTRFQLEKTNFALERDVEQLSTGKRINKAADDAAGSGIATKLLTQVKGVHQAVKNAEDGFTVLQIAEGGLQEMTLFLQRARVLAVMAANDVLTTADRSDIQIEIDMIKDEIDRLSSVVNFNQFQLLNREGTNEEEETITLHIGPNQNETLDLSLKADARAQTLGIDTLDVTTRENAQNTMTQVDDALEHIYELRARIGAEEHRLEGVLISLDAQLKNMMRAYSGIQDADIANVLVQLTRDKIVQQTSVSASAQANSDFKNSLGTIVNLVM
ncbi:MAG: flagellin [Candidatus Hydrogenedentota bacterium]